MSSLTALNSIPSGGSDGRVLAESKDKRGVEDDGGKLQTAVVETGADYDGADNADEDVDDEEATAVLGADNDKVLVVAWEFPTMETRVGQL